MLKKFFLESTLADAFIDRRSGPERLAASPWATATTPDQIIVAHILQSVASDPSQWVWGDYGSIPTGLRIKELKYPSYSAMSKSGYVDGRWKFSSKELEIEIHSWYKPIGDKGYKTTGTVQVKSKHQIPMTLDEDSADVLVSRLSILWRQIQIAEATAKSAKAALELNEKKWALAESLLGMKRNEQGALVPVTPAETQDETGRLSSAVE